MHTKYFTLSAVCALAFGMLLALSGTTDLAPEFEPAKAAAFNLEGPYHPSHDKPSPLLKADHHSPAPKNRTSTIAVPNWNRPHVEEENSLLGILKKISGSTKLRIVGLLFVVAWVLLSIKMLSG